jgi:hypothetical protein
MAISPTQNPQSWVSFHCVWNAVKAPISPLDTPARCGLWQTLSHGNDWTFLRLTIRPCLWCQSNGKTKQGHQVDRTMLWPCSFLLREIQASDLFLVGMCFYKSKIVRILGIMLYMHTQKIFIWCVLYGSFLLSWKRGKWEESFYWAPSMC